MVNLGLQSFNAHHKTLEYIMDPGKTVPITTAALLQRWCFFLGAFSYTVEYRGTRQHSNGVGLLYAVPYHIKLCQ